MRAILIDPFNKTVTEVETPAGLDDIYKLIGHTTIVQDVYVDNGKHMLLVDEEGLLHNEPLPVFKWQGFPQPLAGRAVLFANGGSEWTAATMPLGVVMAHVTFPALSIDDITTHSHTRDDGTFVVENRAHFKRTGKD